MVGLTKSQAGMDIGPQVILRTGGRWAPGSWAAVVWCQGSEQFPGHSVGGRNGMAYRRRGRAFIGISRGVRKQRQ